MTTPTPPAPVPPAPPAAPAASTGSTATGSTPTASTPVALPPPPPPEPEPEDEVRSSGWPTWVTVLVTSTVAIIGMLFVFWLLGAWSFQVRLGEAVDPTPQVVVQTVVVEATAAMPMATATKPIAEATATAMPTAEPTATAAMPTATAAQPTKAPPAPTAVPPTAVPPTALPPTAVPPTAIPPAPTQVPPFGWSSGESGTADVPAGAICWGDQISFDGATFGDGTGPANPVWLTLSKPAKVTMVYGACTTGESWATISDRLKKAPDTSGKTFDPK